MTNYLLCQLGAIVLPLFLIIVLSFLLMHLAPGGPVSMDSGTFTLSEEACQAIVAQYGLDQPMPVQFVKYLGTLAQFDLGTSMLSGRPVSEMVMERLPATLLLSLSGSIIAFVVGVWLAVVTARRRALDLGASLASHLLCPCRPSGWVLS